MATHITIEIVGGAEQSCADLGLSEPMIFRRNMAVSEFTVKQEGRAFDAAPLFAAGTRIKVRSGRLQAAANGAFSGGALVFSGTCIHTPSNARGASEGYDYVFADAWHDLTRRKYGQKWRVWEPPPGGGPAEATSSYVETSRVNVFCRVNSVTNVVTRIHNGDQVRDAVQWAIDHGVNLQIGTITPALYLPSDAKRDLTCDDVIRMALKMTPDAICEIDHRTDPPTFNCYLAAQMTDVVWNLSEEKITAIRLNPRTDLVVNNVVLIYERADEVDGQTRRTTPFVDAAPVDSTGFEDNALLQTIELFGNKVTTQRAEVNSVAVPADLSDVDFWIENGITWLAESRFSNIVITPDARETSLPYILAPGSTTARWMKDDDGNARVTQQETFRATVSYTLSDGNVITTQDIHFRRRVTNLPPRVSPDAYTSIKSRQRGEVAVAGLAAQVLTSVGRTFYDGTVQVTEEECSDDLRLINTLSIAGGTGRYATIKACVQEIALNLADGTRTATLGWPKKLSIAEIIECMRFNRFRNVWQNPDAQSTGDFEDDDVELSDDTSEDDSTVSFPSQSVHVVKTAAGNITANATAATWSLTKPSAAGSVTLRHSETGGKEIKLRELTVQRKTGPNNTCQNWKILVACSDYYQ